MAFYITRQIRLCCVLHSSSAFQKNPVPHSQNQSLDPEKSYVQGKERNNNKTNKKNLFVVPCYAKVTHAVFNIFCHFLPGAVVHTSLYFTPQAFKSKLERKSESNMSRMERLKMTGCTERDGGWTLDTCQVNRVNSLNMATTQCIDGYRDRCFVPVFLIYNHFSCLAQFTVQN